MTQIESRENTINKDQEKLFAFLGDFNNYERIMPDKVKNWQSTKDTCTFEIEGLTSLGMKIIERRPNELVKMVDYGKVPFKFSFSAGLRPAGVGACKVKLFFSADLNPIYKMMAVRPLENFLNMLVDKLEEIDIEQ